MKYEGGAKVSKEEIEDLFTQLERSLPPLSRGGKRGKKMMGGGCTPEQRQRVRIALAAALATGMYLKGPEIATRTAEAVHTVVSRGAETILSAECSVSVRKSAIQNAICTKYSEALNGIDSFVRMYNTSQGASNLALLLTGAVLKSAWGTFRTSLAAVVDGVKDTAGFLSAAFERLVDEICAAMPAVAAPGAAAAAAAPAPAAGLGALAAAAAAQEEETMGQEGQGRRRSRRRGVRMSRRRPSRRSTVRRVRVPLYAPVVMMRPRTF